MTVTLLVTVIMLNLVVAIIMDSFNKVQDQNISKKTKERFRLILESIAIIRALDRFLKIKTIRKKGFWCWRKSAQDTSHLLYWEKLSHQNLTGSKPKVKKAGDPDDEPDELNKKVFLYFAEHENNQYRESNTAGNWTGGFNAVK